MADNEYIKRSDVIGLIEDKIKRCKTVPGAFVCASLRTAVMGLRSADVVPRAEWISVEERLPELHGAYLTHTFRGYMKISHFEEWVIGEEPSFDDYTVTHWMPLPEPPKGD